MDHPPPIHYLGLQCSGKGFAFASHGRASPSVIASALRIPLDKIPNKISKTEKPKVYHKPWWEAQVRLYGLQCSDWTLPNLKRVLTEALSRDGLIVDDQLKEMEGVYNLYYAEDEARFQRRKQEANMARRKYVKMSWEEMVAAGRNVEGFFKGIRDGKNIYGISNSPEGLEKTVFEKAEAQGLYLRIVGDESSTSIIGNSETDVTCEFIRLDAEAAAKKLERDIEARKRQHATARRLMIRQVTLDHHHSKTKDLEDKDVDIGGTWIIEMPGRKVTCGEYDEIVWRIASPRKEAKTFWGTFEDNDQGLIRILPTKGVDSNPPLAIVEAIGFQPLFKEMDCRGNFAVHGVVQLTSHSTCMGTWQCWEGKFEFTGKKISVKCCYTVKDLKTQFEEATEIWQEYHDMQLRMRLGLDCGESLERFPCRTMEGECRLLRY